MNALTVMNPPPVPSFSIGDMERIALAIAKGGLFGSSDPNAVLTLCMLAQSENKHPAQIMQDYDIIKGKPAKKAQAMQRDFLAAGGKIEWHALTDDIADATFSHPMGGSVRISWDNERVKNAGLGGSDNHRKFARAMKRSRVISEGVRTVFPGATSGLYVPEEVQDFAPAPAAEPPRTSRLTGAALIEQASDTPAASLPDAAADAPPTDAGQSTGAASNEDKARAWTDDRIAEIDATQDRVTLGQIEDRAKSKLAKRADLLPLVTAAVSAKLAFLDGLDAGSVDAEQEY
jgi:hypothetical protein